MGSGADRSYTSSPTLWWPPCRLPAGAPPLAVTVGASANIEFTSLAQACLHRNRDAACTRCGGTRRRRARRRAARMGYDHCFLCGRHLRPLKVGASIQKRGLDIIRGPDGTVPTEAIERILCQKVMAPGEQNVHLLPSQGDCYKHLVTVRNTLLAEKSAEEQRFESQRQTRKQALESGPPLPEVAPPRAPRAKLSAAESAARDAADATASFGGPRLGEMNINGASIPLVDGERKTRLQASIEQMATDVVFAQLDHEAVMAAAGVDPDIVAAVDGMIEQVERELMPPPPKPPKDASKPWQPRSVAARPAPDKKKGIPHKNTTLKKLILWDNQIGDEGGKAIGKALEVSFVLVSSFVFLCGYYSLGNHAHFLCLCHAEEHIDHDV